MAIDNILTLGLRQIPRKIRTGIAKTTFLQDHFFGGEGGVVVEENHIELKIQNTGRPAAEEAEWNSKGHILENKNGFKYVLAPGYYMYDRHVVTPKELKELDFEEDPANPMPYDEKLLTVLAKDREDIRGRQDTRVELLAKEVLSTGGYTLKDKGFQDFGIDASMFENDASDKLSSAADKLAWIQKRCQAVYDNSGKIVTEIVMDIDTLFILIGDSTILAMLDTKNLAAGNIRYEKYRDDGVAFHGELMVPGCGAVSLLTYAGKYTASNGTDTKIWDAKTMLFGSANIGNKNYACVYSNAEGNKMGVPVAAKEFVHVVEGDGDLPSNCAVCRQTNVVLAPVTLGGWLFAKNVR